MMQGLEKFFDGLIPKLIGAGVVLGLAVAGIAWLLFS